MTTEIIPLNILWFDNIALDANFWACITELYPNAPSYDDLKRSLEKIHQIGMLDLTESLQAHADVIGSMELSLNVDWFTANLNLDLGIDGNVLISIHGYRKPAYHEITIDFSACFRFAMLSYELLEKMLARKISAKAWVKYMSSTVNVQNGHIYYKRNVYESVMLHEKYPSMRRLETLHYE